MLKIKIKLSIIIFQLLLIICKIFNIFNIGSISWWLISSPSILVLLVIMVVVLGLVFIKEKS